MWKAQGLSKKLAIPGLCFVISVSSMPPAMAAPDAPGDLDLSFAGFGAGVKIIITGVPMPTAFERHGMTLQPDGKIVVVGYTGVSLLVIRYLSNGAQDMTFGDGGIATFLNPQHAMRGTSVAIQADGKIIVAGWADTNPSNFLLARPTTSGTLDPTFSSDGFVTTDFDAGNDYATAVLIQPNGKIVAAGWGSIGTDDDFVAVRYNVDGTLDTAFVGDGKVTIGFGDYDTSYDAALQDDGKLWPVQHPPAKGRHALAFLNQRLVALH